MRRWFCGADGFRALRNAHGLTHERCAELLGHHSSQGGRPATPHVGGGA